MNGMELKNVVCIYMTEHKNCEDHKEMIGIALTDMEAKDFIEHQARCYMEHESFNDIGIEHNERGLTIRHYIESTNGVKAYDRSIGFHYDTSCGKLLIDK